MLADLSSAPTLLVLIGLCGIAAAALWVGMTVLRNADEPPRRAAGSRVVGRPTLRDGVWWRLVADPDGHRRVEVLSPQGWVPSHRNVAQLLEAIPGRRDVAAPKAPS
ncbi:MAG TPA: hypothetical protein VNO26_08010 [Candidatus Limnocylindria bacterium]|nr:hypothetical protein [Candidatus Limnocylindria bacterium]